MLNKEIIIINTSMPLRNYMKRRPTHYAEILSRTNRVINISSVSISKYFCFTNNNSYQWEERIFFRLPGTHIKLIQKLNELFYRLFLKRLIRGLPQKPVFWHFFSGNYEVVKLLPKKIDILEICDDTPEFFMHDQKKYNEVKRNEDEMTKSVDVVFTISEHLRVKKTLRSDIELIRNGVSFEDFSHIPDLPKRSSDELYDLKGDILGYVGAVSRWFDFDLIEYVANELHYINLVFVGRISPEFQYITKRLNKMDNIYFLGERAYRALPGYLKYFDLTHIPFIINELVVSVNPIKLYEYLAAGKRVISTALPEVIGFQEEHIVEIANSKKEYIQKIERMLAKNAEDYTQACQGKARSNTWEQRVESACEIIKRKMKGPDIK